MDISKLELPDWVLWIAQDADGACWGYECEPLQHETGWYENEVGRCVKLLTVDPNPGWRLSLRKVEKS